MVFALIASFSIVVFVIVFKLTIGSIEGLGFKYNTFYPFNKFVPKGNLWSTIFFLIITALITAFTILLSKGKLPQFPA